MWATASYCAKAWEHSPGAVCSDQILRAIAVHYSPALPMRAALAPLLHEDGHSSVPLPKAPPCKLMISQKTEQRKRRRARLSPQGPALPGREDVGIGAKPKGFRVWLIIEEPWTLFGEVATPAGKGRLTRRAVGTVNRCGGLSLGWWWSEVSHAGTMREGTLRMRMRWVIPKAMLIRECQRGK